MKAPGFMGTLVLLLLAGMFIPNLGIFSPIYVQAKGPELTRELKKLEKEGKLTVRALRAWNQLPERFMQLALDLRNHDLDILGADQAGVEELALQAGKDDRLAEYAQDLKALADYMADMVPAEPKALAEAETVVSKPAEPAVSLPPDGVPGWILTKVDKVSGQTKDSRTNTYNFTLDENQAVDRSHIRQSGSGYSRQVNLAFDFSWTQPPAFAFKEDTWQGQMAVTDKENTVEYLKGNHHAPSSKPHKYKVLDPQGFFVAGLRFHPGAGYRMRGQPPVTGESQFMLMTEAGEIRLDQKHSPHQFSADYGQVQDPALNRYLNQKGKQLAAVTHRPDMPYSFRCVNATYVNAYAFPGGSIATTRGILLELENEAELDALLGHEIAHVNARHTAARMSQAITR
jgi:hypothetical protein